MEAALRMLLPRMLAQASFEIYPHQGKSELLRRLPIRLRGYAKWLPSDWQIVVIVDRDDENCGTLKAQLEGFARDAGLPTRSSPRQNRYSVANRLAIEELEAWFFGDWQAVRTAYPGVPATIPNQARYRNPDSIMGGTWEALERILTRAGYFSGGIRKIEAARAIAVTMDPVRNTSPSFMALRDVLLEIGG